MHPAHPRPIRVIVEIDPGQVTRLVTTILDRLCVRAPATAGQAASPASAPADADADDDHDAPAVESTADPPEAQREAPGTPAQPVQLVTTGEALHREDAPLPLTPSHRPEQATAPRPLLPLALARMCYLGEPCPQGHTYQDTPWCLRRNRAWPWSPSSGGSVRIFRVPPRRYNAGGRAWADPSPPFVRTAHLSGVP